MEDLERIWGHFWGEFRVTKITFKSLQLHSISIESPNVNQLINLVALSSIRGDTSLASFYLEKAASLDPSHPQLSVVRTNLDQRISNDKSAKFSYSSFL